MKSLVICLCFLILMQKFARTQKVLTWLISCESDSDCEDLKDGKCMNGICSCNKLEDYVCEPVTRTIMVTKIGLKCEDSTNCNIENSTCSEEKKCACTVGTTPSENGRRCLSIPKRPGDPCEETAQCRKQNALTICQNSKCVCQQGMHEAKGQCYTSIDLGGNCFQDEECSHVDLSRCVNSKCNCIDEYVASSSECLPILKSLNAPCLKNVQCTATLGGGSLCSEGLCQCKDLYQVKQNGTKCVRDIRETCEQHSDCHQPGSGRSRLECVLGVCKCKSTFYEEDGYCISSSIRLQQSVLIVFSMYLLYRILG